MKIDFKEYKEVWKYLFWFLLLIVACRFTKGIAAAGVTLFAIWAIAKKRPGIVMLCYMVLPMLIQVNATLRGGGAIFGMICRVSPVILTILILGESAHRRGRNILPLGGLYPYCFVALVSSVGGWCPPVSYLKLVNFLAFLIGLHVGMKNLHDYPEELRVLRTGLLAFAVFIIFGSIATYPFPSIGYSMFLNNMAMWGEVGDAEEFIREFSGIKLFSGVTNHSQTLAPVTVACVAWTLLDMLFVEKRASWLHMSLIGASPILLFMTRSRIGLLGLVATLTIVYLFALPKASVDIAVRRKVRSLFMGFIMLCMVGAVVAEIKDNSITKWLRKTENVEESEANKDLITAVTQSRQGVIAENMYDFNQNPLLGMGFQTSEFHRYAYQAGRITWYSAPIEKGLLLLMVLGETGVVGGIVFSLFVLMFYAGCKRKGYLCTSLLMTVFFVLNMAESSYFSPGGLGGVLWVVLVGGGFVIDMECQNYNRDFFGDAMPFNGLI